MNHHYQCPKCRQTKLHAKFEVYALIEGTSGWMMDDTIEEINPMLEGYAECPTCGENGVLRHFLKENQKKTA